ncbi:MAG: hypothetical protein ACREMQ_04555 [Longimicrobiales bacterium]
MTKFVAGAGLLLGLAGVAACSEQADVASPSMPQLSAVKFWDATASTAWNTRATTLLSALPEPFDPARSVLEPILGIPS